jgi:hypothetical protein
MNKVSEKVHNRQLYLFHVADDDQELLDQLSDESEREAELERQYEIDLWRQIEEEQIAEILREQEMQEAIEQELIEQGLIEEEMQKQIWAEMEMV